MYISWDSAGWHMSKALNERVEFLNGWANYDRAPAIELAPLPSKAQFLNVIESVFTTATLNQWMKQKEQSTFT